jgi:hypothetical protein
VSSELVVKFDEEAHPRRADGEFTSAGGGSTEESSARWDHKPGETQPKWEPKLDGFTSKQAELLGDYASSGGASMREAMRAVADGVEYESTDPFDAMDDPAGQARAFTKLIDEHPKNYSGTMSRGMSVPGDQIEKWKVGGVISMQVPSSWSTDEKVAMMFAQAANEVDRDGIVVFRAEAKTGVSIMHSVSDRWMREVVNRSNTRYKIVAKRKVKEDAPYRVGEYILDLKEL